MAIDGHANIAGAGVDDARSYLVVSEPGEIGRPQHVSPCWREGISGGLVRSKEVVGRVPALSPYVVDAWLEPEA